MTTMDFADAVALMERAVDDEDEEALREVMARLTGVPTEEVEDRFAEVIRARQEQRGDESGG